MGRILLLAPAIFAAHSLEEPRVRVVVQCARDLHRRLDVCAAGLVVVLFALVCLAWDRAAHARIHPAFLWGGLFLIVSLPLRFAIGGTAAWGALAEWLTQ